MTQALLAPGPQERYDLDADDESLSLLLQSLAQYGDTFRVPSLTRPGDALVINDPDDIRRVLLTHRGNYVKGAGLERVRMLVGNGLIVSEGAAWARQRRLMQPMFQGSANRAFAPMIEAIHVEQVLQEALRLYPPVWLFSRRAIADDTLGGHHVPAGTDIFISPYLLHRNAAHWDRPDAFMPERFAPGAAAGRHRFAYLPFSAGPRFCIGPVLPWRKWP